MANISREIVILTQTELRAIRDAEFQRGFLRGRSTSAEDIKFKLGDSVQRYGGDYSFRGEITSVVFKRSGELRYTVENDDGMIFILNEDNLIEWDGEY